MADIIQFPIKHIFASVTHHEYQKTIEVGRSFTIAMESEKESAVLGQIVLRGDGVEEIAALVADSPVPPRVTVEARPNPALWWELFRCRVTEAGDNSVILTFEDAIMHPYGPKTA